MISEMFGEGCDFTDDTICTMAIADAILNGRSYRKACWIGAAAILLQRERMAEDSRGGFVLLIRSHIIVLAMVRQCEYRRWLGYSMTCRRCWKRQRKQLFLLITTPEGIKGAKAVAHAIWHFRKSKFSEESKGV